MQENGHIMKTDLYNFDPFKPYFYIVKLEFTGVYIIFLISTQKRRLWVLVRTASVQRRLIWVCSVCHLPLRELQTTMDLIC